MTWSPFTDIELVAAAQAGDRRALGELVERYASLTVLIARVSPFFMPDGDKNDLEQEALLGLLSAVRSFRPATGVPFWPFARMCVRRRLVSAAAIRGSALKHLPLTGALRVVEGYHGEPVDVLSTLPAPDAQPETILERGLELRELASNIRTQLTRKEAFVSLARLHGLSYAEIGEALGLRSKQVDRALTRARWRLRGAGPPSRPELGERRPGPLLVCSFCRLGARYDPCSICAFAELEAA